MADSDPIAKLEGLHRDLLAVSEARLPVLERVLNELEERIREFRALLTQPRKGDASRSKLQSGKFTIAGQEYEVNDEFKQEVVRLADSLDLDEMEAAKLYLESQDDAEDLDRPVFTSSMIRFHKRRLLILECVRLTIKHAADEDLEDNIRIAFRHMAQEILNIRDGHVGNGPLFWQKCFGHMGDIERALQSLAERVQSATVVGQFIDEATQEIVDYQRDSLSAQHESLAAITTLLSKDGFIDPNGFRNLISTLRRLEKTDTIVLHYIPLAIAAISQLASADSSCTLREARALHEVVLAGKESDRESDAWASRSLHAATTMWWLVEYSGRYLDNPVGSPLQGVNLEKEAEQRSTRFMEALKDGAFHFMLSTSQDVRPNEWYDPAKAGLISFLLQETPVPSVDAAAPSEHFQVLFMEQQQAFVDAFITNMPDTLRKLKSEEDENRKQIQSQFARGQQEYGLHLERFLMIICLAFEGSPDAAQSFWSDPDGNLYGFLQWAAKRQTTPRVATFCEMLRSISEGEECAESAHKFLLEESHVASGKMRRTSSLSWSQIFNELEFYAKDTRDRPAPVQGPVYSMNQSVADRVTEPESAMMLESYLRLAAHLCRESSTSRTWILENPIFHLHDILFQLCGSAIDSRLRGCAFTAICSLLTLKTPQVSEMIWTSLDKWIFGGAAVSSSLSKANAPGANTWSEQVIFDLISTSFEEPNAFVGLLQALITPYPENMVLNDTLPFPENLGNTYRMTGIRPYLDFAMGRIFGSKSQELQDPIQSRILRLNCLTLAATCLTTFNEDLVIFASRSNINMDNAIGASSLLAYVKLHPFARVMEWLFNDKVITSLFAAAHQDISTVGASAADTPLVLSVMKSIEVMDLMMKLQSTYLDIVRPLVKEENNRGTTVANFALTSFEDAVLNNLSIIVDLGLYCGTGHRDLTIISLNLLEKLSSSRKLVVAPSGGFGQRSERSKMIGILEREGDSERIARSLVAEMLPDPHELEAGPEAVGYVIKSSILKFLTSTLSALSTRPTIAHLLLGFSSIGNTIDVPDEGLFAAGNSLFHAVLRLALEYPDVDGDSFVGWRLAIKQSCIEILCKLWRSPLSAVFAMSELRVSEFLFVHAIRQPVIDANTLWDGRPISDPDFLISESATTFQKFLEGRADFYDYVSRELQQTVLNPMPTLREKILNTLLGSTRLPTGEQVQNSTVFDLFDFIELDTPNILPAVELRYLNGVDFDICREDGPGTDSSYNMRSVEELITLKRNEIQAATQQPNGLSWAQNEEQQFLLEAQSVLARAHALNSRSDIWRAQQKALFAWTQLLTMMLTYCDFDASVKTGFILQSLQILQPKLERSYRDSRVGATRLTDLALTLIRAVDFDAKEFQTEDGRTSDFAINRVVQLFRAALEGVISDVDVTTPGLRETCYQICFRYLRGTSQVLGKEKKPSALSRETMRIVKLAGERTIDVICDDAYNGSGTCRISALLLLESLVSLGIRAGSGYVVDRLVRLNFIAVLVETIKHIPTELRNTQPRDVDLFISFYEAVLSLLLRVAQTRSGAALVLNAGLFYSVRDSQIFSADPDIGFEVDNPTALQRFFNLMLAVLRVINAVVLSRGQQNDHTLQMAREFLKENRLSIIGVFKRNARVGGRNVHDVADLNDLVDQFTLLLSATNFLEDEEKSTQQKTNAVATVFS